jgi:hypothetical protein
MAAAFVIAHRQSSHIKSSQIGLEGRVYGGLCKRSIGRKLPIIQQDEP